MRAIIIKEHGVAAVEAIEEPSVRQGYFKIKTKAVALNPTDVDHVENTGRIGAIVGCDVSGIVVNIGEGCKTEVKKGDSVYGQCHGANMVGESPTRSCLYLGSLLASGLTLFSRAARLMARSPSTHWFAMVTSPRSPRPCHFKKQQR